MTKKLKAMTLTELLVVIAIIGILASMVFTSLGSVRARARDAQRVSDLRTVAIALENFYAKNNEYIPGNDVILDPKKGFRDVAQILVAEKLIATAPVDPKDGQGDYGYRYEGVCPLTLKAKLEQNSPEYNNSGTPANPEFKIVIANVNVQIDLATGDPISPGWVCP